MPADRYVDRYDVMIGGQQVDLPITQIGADTAISLLMTIDRGVAFMTQAGAELADLLRHRQPEVVAAAATLGNPVAFEVSRALGLDDYLILQKTPKIHLADALAEPLSSITTGSPQRLLLDRKRISAVAGKRVAVVDDVIATGGSMAASLRLLRAVAAEVVGIGVLLAEGSAWKEVLGPDAELVSALGTIPGFRRVEGGWTAVWD